MKGHMNTQMGEVLIDTDVIAKYAGSVAVESDQYRQVSGRGIYRYGDREDQYLCRGRSRH